MRRTWIIGGAAVIAAAIVVWALASGGGRAPAAPRSTDAPGIASAGGPASRATLTEGLPTTRIAPRRSEDADGGSDADRVADPVAAPIRVLVTDVADHPIEGIQVLLIMAWKEQRERWPSASSPTGKDGLAFLRAPEGRLKEDVPFEWAVTAGVPAAPPFEAIIDGRRPPPDLVRLVVGATGRVVVHVVDLGNDPVRERVRVRLDALRKNSQMAGISLPKEFDRTTDRGEAIFELVGIGTMLQASVWCDNRRSAFETIGAGPGFPGAEASLTVTVDVSKPFVTGRILDLRGDPWRETEFHGRVVCGDPREQPTDLAIHTDEAGRFRIEVLEGLYEGHERHLEIRHEVGPDNVDARTVVDLTRALPAGDTDVGDVTLTLPSRPLILSGTVLDDDGKPVAGASLMLERARLTGAGVSWDGMQRWDLQSETDDAGRFEIRGTCDPGAFRASAHHPDSWADNPVEIALGQENVVLHLYRAGAIEGSVELPEGIRGDHISVWVHLEDGGDRTSKAFGAGAGASAARDGSFRIAALRSGSFTVSVKPWSDQFIPVEITGVVVRAGETTRDPRLQKIRTPSRGRQVFLTVVDSDGHDVTSAAAAEIGLPAGPRSSEHLFVVQDSRIKLFLRGASADFVVGAVGYRRKVITVDADQKVVLEKGIPVHFVAAGLPKPLPEGVRARIGLIPEAVLPNDASRRPEDLPGRTSIGEFGAESHSADFSVGEPGRHKVRIILFNLKTVAYLAEESVEVADVGTPQTFTIAIKPEALRAALEKLEGK